MADMETSLSKEGEMLWTNDQNTMDYRFSHHCGENVDLSKEKFKASWTHRFSDGVAFSCQPIQNYTRLKLDLAGTGHAYVGTISRDPETIKCMRNTLSHDVNVLKEMKVHKRLCAVDIKTLNKDGRQHVSFNFPGEEKHKEADEDIWLFLYIKFGDLVAVIHSDDTKHRSFHHVTGSNIHCMDQDRRSIKLQVENPSAVCCLNKRLKPGYSVTIKIKPLAENGHVPSRCHLKLGIVDLDPSELRSCDPESFVVDRKIAMPKRWTILQKFAKENIEGALKVYLTNTGELFFKHDSGIEGTHKCRVKDLSAGVLVILDLFRSEATVTTSNDEDSYETVEKDYDYVMPDEKIVEKVKDRLRISDKKHEKERLPKVNEGYIKMVDMKQSEEEIDKIISACKRSPRLKRGKGEGRKIPSPANFEMCK